MHAALHRLLTVPSVAALALSASAVMLPTTASAASASVVISEVYGGGGNSGATLTHDFIELYNPTDAAISLDGWKLQYFSGSGKPGGMTLLSGSIAPHSHFLVQEAKGSGGTAGLPAPDASGTLAMSGTAGSVQVVDAAGQVVDLVGYGAVAKAEGAAAPGTSNTTSAFRRSVCTDTDDNAADFTTGTPNPANAASGPVGCTPGGGDQPPVPGPVSTVEQVQGASHTSPLVGRKVHGVAGVVVAVGANGFYLQATQTDDDPATSAGVYVYTRTAPTVQVGNAVTVDATVTEFRPGGSGGANNLTTTQLTGPVVTVTAASAPLPAPVVIGVDRVAPQQSVTTDDPGTVEAAAHVFAPATNGIDFYESLEGMRVAVRDAEVVGPTKSFGELSVVPGQKVTATRSSFGGVVYSGYDRPNSMRIQVDDALIGREKMPRADVGDRLRGDTVGVIDYGFSNYKLEATQLGTHAATGRDREVTGWRTGSELAVASFNVENLDPTDPQEKFDRLARQIVHNLRAPQVLALEEIQDNNGAQNDGTVDSSTTTDKLVAAIKAAGGPAYDAFWVDPVDGKDGGEPGGNIRSVFLVAQDGQTKFVTRPGGTATTATGVSGTGRSTRLTASPGLVNPTSPAWTASRKPLVGELRHQGRSVFVIANHFSSKGGDQPLFGRFQQPVRSSETKRHQQATEVRGFVDQLLAHDRNARVLVLGDLNDYEFSRTADILVGSGATRLTDLPRTLPASERWTYVYEGNSQVLDHILISPALATKQHPRINPFTYDIVHTNAAFQDQDSDHDPQVVRLYVSPTRGCGR